jgi:hypothetical protein
MTKLLALLFALTVARVWAQETTVPTPDSTATGTPGAPVTLIKKWNPATVPWDNWFKDNAMVTDKTDHVHFFWNAQDFKVNFEVKEKKARLAQAALELVNRLFPADAKEDPVKVDIVYVLERDSYGQPKWDTLQQVAHFEFSRSKALQAAGKKNSFSATWMKKFFDKSDFF